MAVICALGRPPEDVASCCIAAGFSPGKRKKQGAKEWLDIFLMDYRWAKDSGNLKEGGSSYPTFLLYSQNNMVIYVHENLTNVRFLKWWWHFRILEKKTLLYLTRQNILYIWNTTVAPWTTPVKLDWTAIYTIFVFEIAFESLRIHWRIPMRIAMRILEWILDGLILCMYGIRGSSQGSSLYTFLTRLYITLKTVCRFNRMVIGLAKLRP